MLHVVKYIKRVLFGWWEVVEGYDPHLAEIPPVITDQSTFKLSVSSSSTVFTSGKVITFNKAESTAGFFLFYFSASGSELFYYGMARAQYIDPLSDKAAIVLRLGCIAWTNIGTPFDTPMNLKS